MTHTIGVRSCSFPFSAEIFTPHSYSQELSILVYSDISEFVKCIAISRFADSSESDACTRFLPISRAKSQRMVPGAASIGFVAPFTVRMVAIAPLPSMTIDTDGDDVIK